MLKRPPYYDLLCLRPLAQLTVVDAAPWRQAHGQKVATGRGGNHVLSPVLALGRGQALAELGCTGMDELVIGCDAEIQRPALGRANATDGVGAHDSPARLSAVAIQHMLVEPDVQHAEVAAECAEGQGDGLRVGGLGNTGHSLQTRSTIHESGAGRPAILGWGRSSRACASGREPLRGGNPFGEGSPSGREALREGSPSG